MAKHKIYPFAVASIRSMENRLLSHQKLMQMAEAKDAAEAIRILCETDYGKTEIENIYDFEKLIRKHLEEEYQAVGKLIPSETFMDIFRFKNDYHNVKVLIKEEISKVSGKKYLVQGGSIPLDRLQKNFRDRNYMELPNIKEEAVQEAIELYAKTKNAGCIDTILDKACFQVMSEAAEKLGNAYVSRYVKKLADMTNLKTLLRIWKLKRSDEELEQCLVPGGELPCELLQKAFKNDSILQTLKETSYGELCETYMPQGFTAFEKACDDYLMECIKDAKYKTLTPEPVAAYILAKETEAKCVRIILTCKLQQMDEATIKERVREAYV